jgi:hypothetical protein
MHSHLMLGTLVLGPVLFWYVGLETGINTGMNTGIKYQTSLVWPKSGTSLIPVQANRDLR